MQLTRYCGLIKERLTLLRFRRAVCRGWFGYGLVAMLAIHATRGFASPGENISFGVLGDIPYSDSEVSQMRELITDMNSRDLAFVVHIGDIKNGDAPCTDTIFTTRKNEFDRAAHPFIYVPGDNEWTDCHRRPAGGYEPLERLQKLRSIFFESDYSLGLKRLRLARQSASPAYSDYRENVRWETHRIMFVALNIPGSNNNWRNDGNNDEFFARLAANSTWLTESFKLARTNGLQGLVILIQADPEFGALGDIKTLLRRDGYRELKDQLASELSRFREPVLLVHGDSHRYRFDQIELWKGDQAVNLMRLETFGSPQNGWVRVTVAPQADSRFSVEPHPHRSLEKSNRR